MSIKIMSGIWYTEFRDLSLGDEGRNAKASSCKSVLLAIADQANDEGEGSYPGLTRLELKTALSRQGVIDVIKALKYNGLLYVADEPSKLGTNDYKIELSCFPQLSDKNDNSLLVKPLDQSSHLTSTSQVALPALVKPLDSIHPLTVHESNIDVSKKSPKRGDVIDAMLAYQNGEYWKGRETFLVEDLPLADFWHTATGQPLNGNKAQLKSLRKAVTAWRDQRLSVASLQAALDNRKAWKKGGLVSDPNEITADAAAIEAAGGLRTDESRGEYRPSRISA